MTKRSKLRDLTISRIAIARQGINPHAHILVAKAEDDCDDEDEKNPFTSAKKKKEMKDKMEKATLSILDTIATGLKDAEVLKHSATTEDFRDILPSETLTSLETVIKSALSATSLGEQMSIQEHIDSLPEEVVTYVADLETQVATLTKSLEEAAKPAEPEVDPVAKAIAELPAEAQEILKSTTARLEKAEKELAASRIAKATEVWVAKAAAFKEAVEDTNALGNALREVADIKPELADTIEKAFATAAERVAKGNLFKEVGYTGPAATDAEARVEVIAKSLREVNPKLTEAAALAQAWTENPELYNQYVTEQRQKNR
jgi:hypothetical protein